jgi:thiosulfate/3-mercaptopyruvate sulfurtransferase
MHVMNGGKAAWKEAGYELSTEVGAAPTAVTYTFSSEPDVTRFASMEDVMAAMNDTNVILLDTREPEEYQGDPYISKGACYPYKKGAFTNGRIPGSIHLNWSDAVDLDGDHRFKSLKDLKYNFEKAGITPDKKIIAYCQSGVRSAHTTYVLTELLGYKDVRNYDGSWIEWSYNHVNGGKVPIEQDIDAEEHRSRMAALEAELEVSKKAAE